MPMPVVHQFSNGVMDPLLAYVMAFVGCLLGLSCIARARVAASPAKKVRLLVYAACAIGGAGIWVMHMTAMLGFDVPASPVRYNMGLVVASLIVAVVVVGIGVSAVIYGRRTVPRLLLGGLFTGSGVAAMHFTAMASMRMDATFSYNPRLVLASVIVAVVAATAALAVTVRAQGWGQFASAAAILAAAMAGMHYAGMAALRVRLQPRTGIVPGVSPPEFLLPVMLFSITALICLLFGALDMMTDDKFPLRSTGPRSARTSAASRLRRRAPNPSSTGRNTILISGIPLYIIASQEFRANLASSDAVDDADQD